jgi:predicted TIM-barrel fold metal-dependent hydrolase
MAEGDRSDDGFPIVDAHHHLWDLSRNYYPWLCDPNPILFRYGDYSSLKRNYSPEDYRRDSANFNIVKTVHMEAEWDRADPAAETRWLETIHAASGFPNAFVGHAELDRADIAEVLAAHAKSPLVRGIRHKPASAPSPAEAKRGQKGSMDDPGWRRGYALLEIRGFSYDLQTPWWHLNAAAELARDFPSIQIVINHTGLPADRSPEGLAGWRRAMEKIAAQNNVALKISGIGLRGLPWTVERNGPIIRDAIAIFGADRCMFASNFPVDGVVGSFATIFNGFREATAHETPENKRKLFHDNAVRIYRLS